MEAGCTRLNDYVGGMSSRYESNGTEDSQSTQWLFGQVHDSKVRHLAIDGSSQESWSYGELVTI